MNKKIWIGSLLAVLMLVSISLISSAEVSTDVETKESPLYGIRTRRAIGEKIVNIIEVIKTKFLKERIFFLPFNHPLIVDNMPGFWVFYTKEYGCECQYTNIWSYGTCSPTCGLQGGSNSFCGDCSYDDDCDTSWGPTCGRFCNK